MDTQDIGQHLDVVAALSNLVTKSLNSRRLYKGNWVLIGEQLGSLIDSTLPPESAGYNKSCITDHYLFHELTVILERLSVQESVLSLFSEYELKNSNKDSVVFLYLDFFTSYLVLVDLLKNYLLKILVLKFDSDKSSIRKLLNCNVGDEPIDLIKSSSKDMFLLHSSNLIKAIEHGLSDFGVKNLEVYFQYGVSPHTVKDSVKKSKFEKYGVGLGDKSTSGLTWLLNIVKHSATLYGRFYYFIVRDRHSRSDKLTLAVLESDRFDTSLLVANLAERFNPQGGPVNPIDYYTDIVRTAQVLVIALSRETHDFIWYLQSLNLEHLPADTHED